MKQGQTILVIGSGGREHALAWALARSASVAEILVAPGNAGTAQEAKCRNVQVGVEDIPGLLALALQEKVSLTVVGPEVPLALGVVDAFRKSGLRIFGPTQAAARLESSKAFTKEFLERHQISTAAYAVFTDVSEALAYLDQRQAPIVVKADGLAAGKGVVVATSMDEARAAVTDMLSGSSLGDAGARVVIEDFLEGEEASFIVVADGEKYVALASSQDHKRIFDGDKGPNTGGMGAYSPAPVVTPVIHDRICSEVIEPALKGMVADGCPFEGFLYAGLMISPEGGLKVLEFNTRMGDPETQPILFRLESELLELLDAAVDGKLEQAQVRWNPEPAIGVVMAAQGYPASARKNDRISGLGEVQASVKVFHAGTSLNETGDVVTSGGRVLCVVATGADIRKAQAAAYENVEKISWDGAQYRKDIAYRAIARES
tara:strand:- start:12636 stop:13931 length:1296 start_codon:yes stop_codon:yes gene_type:complete